MDSPVSIHSDAKQSLEWNLPLKEAAPYRGHARFSKRRMREEPLHRHCIDWVTNQVKIEQDSGKMSELWLHCNFEACKLDQNEYDGALGKILEDPKRSVGIVT